MYEASDFNYFFVIEISYICLNNSRNNFQKNEVFQHQVLKVIKKWTFLLIVCVALQLLIVGYSVRRRI